MDHLEILERIKRLDIVDVPEGAPLRVWTRNNGEKDAAALAGLDRNWLTSDPETFKAHLVDLRGFGTSTDVPGSLHPYTPMAVTVQPQEQHQLDQVRQNSGGPRIARRSTSSRPQGGDGVQGRGQPLLRNLQ